MFVSVLQSVQPSPYYNETKLYYVKNYAITFSILN